MSRRRKKKTTGTILPFFIALLCVGAIGFAMATIASHTTLLAHRTELPGIVEDALGDEQRGDDPGVEDDRPQEESDEDGEKESPSEDEERFDYDDVTHIETPEAVKALYVTSCAIGTPSLRNHVFGLVDTTEINSVVIDIKDYTGTLSFDPRDPDLQLLYENAPCGSPYMGEIIADLHEKGVYVIGRITVFQDQYFPERHPEEAVQHASDGSIWTDHKGLSFTDPSSQAVWDHTVAIAEASYDIGFDELNFDYVRFPTDGNMSTVSYPQSGDRAKADVIEDFFIYLDEHLDESIPEAVTSADLFGLTTTARNDLNIGQVLERALPHFDYIAPMVYPSHYPAGFEGYADPNTAPYDIVHIAMKSGVERAEEAGYDADVLRSWIQDFDYGGNYDADAVRAQIEATHDAGVDSWMVWDPANMYTSEAFEAAD